MKTIIKVLVSILAIIGIIIGGWKVKEQMEYNQMVEIVKSEEVDQYIKKNLKNIEDTAFTDTGKIQFYEIDYKSIVHHPMGGIMFDIYINGSKNLEIGHTLHKDTIIDNNIEKEEFSGAIIVPENVQKFLEGE